jgi:hypothetical protein
MRRLCLLALGLLLPGSAPAEAHRLDEYLQATRLAVSRDRVVVELDLTPGVMVAKQVFATIDRDGDARVSPIEIEDYARRVLRDLSLLVDGRPYTLTLARAESSSWEEIREGEGTIHLEAFADTPLARGVHRIRYANMHESTSGVFLVNALKPSAPAVAIRSQRRDMQQHGIDLDVDVGASLDAAAWFVVPVAALAALAIRRRPRDRQRVTVTVICSSVTSAPSSARAHRT